jgi:uncharacterized coiled-coil DUF342 family protein
MVKKAKKKAKARKRLTPLEKIKKELAKLEALHDKENAIVEKMDEIIEEAQEDDEGYQFEHAKWEGTD